MKTNNFKLPIYIFFVAIIQVVINNISLKFYVDLLGLVIVILILSNNYNFKSLILLSLVADLIGHWYLGTHLIAAILLTLVSTSITNFFNISSFLHKCIMLMIFSTIFLCIILIMDALLHNIVINPISLFIEIVIFAPLLLKFMDKRLTKQTQDFIF